MSVKAEGRHCCRDVAFLANNDISDVLAGRLEWSAHGFALAVESRYRRRSPPSTVRRYLPDKRQESGLGDVMSAVSMCIVRCCFVVSTARCSAGGCVVNSKFTIPGLVCDRYTGRHEIWSVGGGGKRRRHGWFVWTATNVSGCVVSTVLVNLMIKNDRCSSVYSGRHGEGAKVF